VAFCSKEAQPPQKATLKISQLQRRYVNKKIKNEINLSSLVIGSIMESLLKIAFKKSPIPTLGTALLYFCIKLLIENNLIQDIETSKLVIILGVILLFSLSLLTYKTKSDISKLTIRDVSAEDIDSSSDIVIGKKSASKSSSETTINGVKTKGAKTGGDFVIGEKITKND
jgi:hypothetical protein